MCLEKLKDLIPHYENENVVDGDDYVKPVFSNLVLLYNGDVGGKCRERIANPEKIKKFLSSIKDWDTWNSKAAGYLAGETCVYNGYSVVPVKKIRVLSLGRWSQYQKWRFEQYFIKGVDTLPDSKSKPGAAYAQMGKKLPDNNLVDPILDDDDYDDDDD